MKIYEFTGNYIEEKSYVICENRKVLMIDVIWTEELDAFLAVKNPESILILLTHEHFDHIYGVNHYRELYNCKVMCSKSCGKLIQSSRTNLALYQSVILGDRLNGTNSHGLEEDYGCFADVTFEETTQIEWEGHVISMHETPGHSKGSICIQMDDQYLFTGDSLLLKNQVITKAPGGSRKDYQEVTKPYLKSIPKDVWVYPGHGESALMKEFIFSD